MRSAGMEKKIRVVLWSELFWPHIGGAEIFATKLLGALQNRGYQCLVITRQDSSDLPTEGDYEGIPIYRLPLWQALTERAPDRLLLLQRQVTERIRSFHPDLFHAHGVSPIVFFALETTKRHRRPLVLTLINEEPPDLPIGRQLLERGLHSATWVTSKATSALTHAQSLVPEITPRSSVIHNGLAIPAEVPAPLPFESPRLVCLGRLAPQKGFDMAIAVVASLRPRFPHLRLIIAGDGLEREALTQQAAACGISQAVEFTGWIAPEQVFGLMNTATLVLMPSRWEGLPSVALQAGAMARPVVATRVGGLPEVIVHQQTGLLIEPDESEQLAEAIIFLLDHPDVARQLGQAARQRVQDVFSMEQCVDAYDTIYQKLLTPTPVQEKR